MITTSGNGLVVRDVSSQQMNSSDSKTDQSNIIYFLQAINNTDSNIIKGFLSKVVGKIFVCSNVVGICKSGRYGQV